MSTAAQPSEPDRRDAGGPAGQERAQEQPPHGGDEHPAAIAVLRRVDRGLGVVEQVLLAVLLAALIAIGSIQAIANQLFNTTFQWSEQIIRYAVFYVAMLGAALSAHTDRLIAMDFVSRKLPDRLRLIVRQALRVFAIAMCAAIVAASVDNYVTLGKEAHSGLIPSDLGSLALPVGAGLVGFHVLVRLIVDVSCLARGAAPPEEGAVSLH